MTHATTAFRHATVLPCTGSDPIEDATVVVEAGLIKDITTAAVSADDAIDCAGRTLMPGLIDAHVHVCSLDVEIPRQARENTQSLLAFRIGAIIRQTLDQGYATIRDAGGAEWGMKEAVDRGIIPGPRMFVSG